VGNAAVSRMLATMAPPFPVPLGVFQRDGPRNPADPDIAELLRLNGLAMPGLLAAVDGLGGRRSNLRGKIRSAWGVNFNRMELAFAAAGERGTAARDFAFAHYVQLRALGYRDQRDAMLRFVDPGFVPPKKRAPGDKLTIAGLAAVVHRGYIRKQRSKADGLPWIAYNPGAVGNGPSFKSPGGYGTTIGAARINIYSSEAEGMAGLVAWIRFQARVNRISFRGFFSAHAPADDGTAANKGNDPQAYFTRVAAHMGLDPKTSGGRPLASLDAEAVANAIMAVGEGYTRAGETLEWPADQARLDRETWFAMMYWETLPPGN